MSSREITPKACCFAGDYQLAKQDEYFGNKPGGMNPFITNRSRTFEELNDGVDDRFQEPKDGCAKEGGTEFDKDVDNNDDDDAPANEKDGEHNMYAGPNASSKIGIKKQEADFRNQTSKVSHVTVCEVEQLVKWQQTTQTLLYCNNKGLIHDLVIATISEPVILQITFMCRELPIKGKFYIDLDVDGTPFLDWTRMSMYLLHQFIDVLKSAATSGCYETDAALTASVTRKALDMLISANLADFAKNSTASIAALHAKVLGPFVTDIRISEYLDIAKHSSDMSSYAFEYLLEKKGKTYKTRVTHLLDILRERQYYVVASAATVGIKKLLSAIVDAIRELTMAWQELMRWIDPLLIEAFNMPIDDLRAKMTLSIIGKSKFEKRDSGNHDNTNPNKKQKKWDSSSSSSSGASSAKPPAASKDAIDQGVTWDQCHRCGGRHNPVQSSDWTCPFLRHKHPHHNSDNTLKWEDTASAKLYRGTPWTQKKKKRQARR